MAENVITENKLKSYANGIKGHRQRTSCFDECLKEANACAYRVVKGNRGK